MKLVSYSWGVVVVGDSLPFCLVRYPQTLGNLSFFYVCHVIKSFGRTAAVRFMGKSESPEFLGS